MSRTPFINFVLLASLALVSIGSAEARGRKFSCPLPDKRACISVEQAYNATNNGGKIGVDGQTVVEQTVVVAQPVMLPKPPEQVGGKPVQTPDRCCSPVRTAVTVKGDTLAVASPVVPVAVSQPQYVPARQDLVVRTTREEPFRVPAQVMRIYISPWEDEQGDLHMGGYMFSEIAPRKWSVGTRQTASSEGYRLLTLTHPSRDAAQDETTGKSDATAQAGRAE